MRVTVVSLGRINLRGRREVSSKFSLRLAWQRRPKPPRIGHNGVEFGQNLCSHAPLEFSAHSLIPQLFRLCMAQRLNSGGMNQDVGIKEDHFRMSR
jgi:hypothetical protein